MLENFVHFEESDLIINMDAVAFIQIHGSPHHSVRFNFDASHWATVDGQDAINFVRNVAGIDPLPEWAEEENE